MGLCITILRPPSIPPLPPPASLVTEQSNFTYFLCKGRVPEKILSFRHCTNYLCLPPSLLLTLLDTLHRFGPFWTLWTLWTVWTLWDPLDPFWTRPKVSNIYKSVPKGQNCPKCPKGSTSVKCVQNCQEVSTISKRVQSQKKILLLCFWDTL